MSKKWTLESAVSYLNATGVEVKGKRIVVGNGHGTKGLTGCSAIDYLINYCGYLV